MVPHAHISIHAPLTGRDQRQREEAGGADGISIHAPLTGRDPYNVQMSATSMEFQSTRPLRGTTGLEMMIYSATVFQSTRPLRGTTAWHNSRYRQQVNFNPRAPYGARRCLPTEASIYSNISIHVPRTGHDCWIVRCNRSRPDFNPRAPYGARRAPARMAPPRRTYFNPRAPYGARRVLLSDFSAFGAFQSTCPVRGTTEPFAIQLSLVMSFQSTCPVRGTTEPLKHLAESSIISIHVPRTGHDSKNAQIVFCIFAITDNKSGKVIM